MSLLLLFSLAGGTASAGAGTAAGTSTAAAVGTAIHASVGSATGSATATALSVSGLGPFRSALAYWIGGAFPDVGGTSAGFAFGTSDATAIGRSAHDSVGIAAGSSFAFAASSSASVYTFTVAGVSQSIRSGSLRITETANGRNLFECEIVSLDGAYRPAIGAEVILTEDAVRIFAGTIDVPSESGFFPHGGTAIVTRISAVDFNSLADRRHVTLVQNEASLHSWLTLLTPFLPGVTLYFAQPTGPMLPRLEYNNRLAREILDELSVLTGHTWEIDYYKILRMVQPGTVTAPFAVVPAVDDHAIGDITVEPSRVEHANSIILRAGSGIREVVDTFAGNGSQVVFPLSVPQAGFPAVYHNGNYVHTAIYGIDTLFKWTYSSAANAIIMLPEAPAGTFHSPPSVGDTITVVYPGQYPITFTADNLADQAIHGIADKVIDAPDVFDPVVAQALADSFLARSIVAFETVRYNTFEKGVRPHQTQVITVPDRQISGTHLITDVETTDTPAHTLVRRITAVGGTQYPGSWRDAYRQTGSGGGGTSTVSGVPILASGGFFDSNVVANHTADGTNLRWESSLQSARTTTVAAGPALDLGRDGDSNRWSLFADYFGGGVGGGPALNVVTGGSSQFGLRLGRYPTGGTHQFVLHKTTAISSLTLGAPVTFGLATLGHRIDGAYLLDLDVSNGFFERGRTTRAGEYVSPSHSDANYLGDGVDANWVVSAGAVITYKYRIIGRSLLVLFTIAGTNVPNAGVINLQIAIPGGFTAVGRADATGNAVNAGSTTESVSLNVVNGGSVISISRYSGTWTVTSSFDTNVTGQIELEV